MRYRGRASMRERENKRGRGERSAKANTEPGLLKVREKEKKGHFISFSSNLFVAC